jgi:hypothetical protein
MIFYMPVERQDVLCYGIVRPSGVIYSFPDFFLPSLQLYNWNLVYCFVVKSYCSSLRFGVIISFFEELRPWNLAEFHILSVFETFFGHLCSYRIETWFIV